MLARVVWLPMRNQVSDLKFFFAIEALRPCLGVALFALEARLPKAAPYQQERPWRRWYSTARWRRLRQAQFQAQPFCEMCRARGLINDGSRTMTGEPQPDNRRRYLVCDHVTPHRGDEQMFWSGPFQTLCPDHHDVVKQGEEGRGYSGEVSVDGWPIDPRHPANRGGAG